MGRTRKLQPPARARKRLKGRSDTEISAAMLKHAQREILKCVRLDRTYDIPYLAGYSRNGRTIYIDRHLPRTLTHFWRRVRVDPFLILHEAIEKALLGRLGLHYQHAHQIALRAEQAAVKASGISWRAYDRFMQQHIKHAADERLTRVPADLEIKPYTDERDYQLLKRMQRAMRD
ncbi:MAG TPA: hypothetical protein VGM03_06980 [Phycisphaerae bacterium]